VKTVKAKDADGRAGAKEALGQQLKSMFDAVAAAPMPDEINRLVDDLDAKYAEDPDAPKE
jgi:hypothetical protein